ncbi:alpha/beta hydrolase family protein [Pseudomonas aeruginosa]
MPAFSLLPKPSALLPLLLAAAFLPPAFVHAEEEAAKDQPPAPVERPAVSERSQDETKGLERQLPEDGQQILKAGDESFLTLWLPANTAEAEGVVILVPGDGESPDWPQAIGPLRRKLPDAGWQTLSLALPDPQSTAPVTRPAESAASASADKDASAADSASKPDVKGESGNAPAPESTAEAGSGEPAQSEDQAPPPAIDPVEQRKAHAERVMARLQASIDLALQHEPKSVVLLGHGTGAYWAARYLAEKEPAEIHNLLLVAAEVPRDFRPALEDMVPKLKLATGDFYYRDARADREAARLRMQAGKRQKHPAYVQIAMQALPADPKAEQEQLYRRIRGWLSLHLQADAQKPAE